MIIFVLLSLIIEVFLDSHPMEFTDLKPEEIERAANMLKAISHPMRLAILGYLSDGNQIECNRNS